MKMFVVSVSIFRNNAFVYIVNSVNGENVFTASRRIEFEYAMKLAEKYKINFKCDDLHLFGMIYKIAN
jgi:hypothetical protein